jgi:hypothetical protein
MMKTELPMSHTATLTEVLDRVRKVAAVGVLAISYSEKQASDQKRSEEDRLESFESCRLLNSLFNDLSEKYGITRSAIPLARLISHLNTIEDKVILTEIGLDISDTLFTEEIPRDPDGMVQRTIVNMVLREQRGR